MAKKCDGCQNGASLGFEIRTAFQPIVDLETLRPYAFEALVRGSSGESAATILSRVNDENRYAFDQVCRVNAIREAVSAGLLGTDAKLSINFMPNAVYSPLACIRLTLETAMETGLPIDRIIFEFTENEQLDPAHVREIVRAYRALGFTTAIDDFGAGHAGLGLLANLQTDALKLDMELIRNVNASRPRQQIVKSMVGLCREMGLRLIAEGVETEAELEALASAGVRYVQGYLLARPQIGVLPEIMYQARKKRRAA